MNADFLKEAMRGFAFFSDMPPSFNMSKRQLIHQYKATKLYYYAAQQPKISTPLLIVFAMINKPYILDLHPDYSFINRLNQQGLNVYLLDWGQATHSDKNKSFGDYINQDLHHHIQFILRRDTCETINLLGICQGGVLSLCYAALFKTIHKLILISTPIDFKTKENIISGILQHLDLTKISSNLPGIYVKQFFASLQPFQKAKDYLRFVDRLDVMHEREKFLLVEQWLNDSPDQSKQATNEFITHFYQNNNLIRNILHLNGRKINLDKVNVPVLNIMGRFDSIVPMSASKPLKNYLKHYHERVLPAGHIGLYISQQSGEKLPRIIGRWLRKE